MLFKRLVMACPAILKIRLPMWDVRNKNYVLRYCKCSIDSLAQSPFCFAFHDRLVMYNAVIWIFWLSKNTKRAFFLEILRHVFGRFAFLILPARNSDHAQFAHSSWVGLRGWNSPPVQNQNVLAQYEWLDPYAKVFIWDGINISQLFIQFLNTALGSRIWNQIVNFYAIQVDKRVVLV